jgi:hypothetical protein
MQAQQTSKRSTRRSSALIFAGVAISAVLVGCASQKTGLDPKLESGYLGGSAYGRLQPVDSPDEGVKIYRYKNPNADFAKYKSVIIDPVVIYQTATADAAGNGISEQTIYQVRQEITNSLKESVAKRAKVVDKAGAGVARISIAITGAQTLSDGFRPTDLIPVRAVLNVASKAAGINEKNAMLVVEAKVVDSQTGGLLGEAVYTVSGEQFRLESNSVEAFRNLAQKWVQTALRVAAGNRP